MHAAAETASRTSVGEHTVLLPVTAPASGGAQFAASADHAHADHDALLAAPRYGDLTQLARWKMWAMLAHCASTAADERTRDAHRRLSPETGSKVKREAKGRLEAFTLGAVMAIRK